MTNTYTDAFYKLRSLYQPKLSSTLENFVTADSEVLEKTHIHNRLAIEEEKLRELFPNTFDFRVEVFKNSEEAQSNQISQGHKNLFPTHDKIRCGVVFSGGPAPGGHNVIAGIWDALQKYTAEFHLFGFLGGPGGILKKNFLKLEQSHIKNYLNTGGFHLLGTGRDKIEKPDELNKCLEVCKSLELNFLIIIGGDDSNTNAAVLSEFFIQNDFDGCVIGVPKTIDADMQNQFLATTFGFDSTSRVYSELISSICNDCLSTKKYYHVIRLMGRSASHLTLEACLQTQPTFCFISEEIAHQEQSFEEICDSLFKVILDRSLRGKNYGVVLLPEGLIENSPDLKALIFDLNKIIHDLKLEEQLLDQPENFSLEQSFSAMGIIKEISSHLPIESKKLWLELSFKIQTQLLSSRDPHGNLVVSSIQVEELILSKISRKIIQHNQQNPEQKIKTSFQTHFLGYEGRSVAPTNFDADYAYNLGYFASCLGLTKKTSVMSCLRHLEKTPDQWQPVAIPLFELLRLENRKGKIKPVIQKKLVDIDSPAFRYFTEHRHRWQSEDCFAYSPPVQYFGALSTVNHLPKTLELNLNQTTK